MKKWVALLVAALMALVCLAPAAVVAEGEELEPVTLDWYVATYNTFENQIPRITDYLNENYLKEKINVELVLHTMDATTYNATIPSMLASGASMDILNVANNVNYQSYVLSNAFVNLDELLPKYAPVTYNEMIPADGWEAVRVNGSIYAFVPMKDWAERAGFLYNKTMAEELDIDVSKYQFDRMSSMIELLYDAKEIRDAADPSLAGLPIGGADAMTMHYEYVYERLIGSGNLACVNITSELDKGFAGFGENQVFCAFDTDEYRQAAKMQRQLVVDGLRLDDESSFNVDKALNDKLFSYGCPTGFVTYDEESSLEQYGYLTGIIFSDISLVTGTSVRNGLQAVSVQSANPERAVMFLELVNSESEIITTMAFGIEGEDWTDEDGDGVLTRGPLPEGTWGTWYPWMYGSITQVRVVPPGYTADFPELIAQLNAESTYSSNMGFVLDTAPIANEISACDAAFPEFDSMLKSGQYDNTDEIIDQLIEKLNANGLQKILDEVQSQLNAWVAEQSA